MIDNLPAIRAFVEERIKQQKAYAAAHSHLEHIVAWSAEIVRELELILALCDGLQKQNDTLAVAFAEANIPI